MATHHPLCSGNEANPVPVVNIGPCFDGGNFYAEAVDLVTADGWFQTSDFRFLISDFGFHVSDFRFEMSDFRFRVSGFSFRMSCFMFQFA